MLNAAQEEVAKHQNGALLVIAGAGTGKTRTLIHRYVNLIEKGVSPDKILLLTFTRKAALEMTERAEKLLKNRQLNSSHLPAGGTFHSIAFKWLKQLKVIQSGFSIVDDNDLKKLIRLDLEKSEKEILTKASISLDNLLQIKGLMINLQENLDAILLRYFPLAFSYKELLQEIFQRLKKRKLTANLFDYDDLLAEWLELLESPKGEIIKNTYSYIMVDEYQDTSCIQVAILRELAKTHQNLMAVGDDCQSIYSFRGALATQMNSFTKDFTGAKIVKLQDNYRSSQAILDMCNDVISQASEVFPKTLKSANNLDGNVPQLIKRQNETEIAYTLLEKIFNNQNRGIPLSNQAVLFRSSIQVHNLERILVKEKIPYKKFGGIKITEAAHLKDFISIIGCPFSHNTAAWLRVLEMLPGIGTAKAQQLLNDYKIEKLNLEKIPDTARIRFSMLLEIFNKKPTDQPQVEFIDATLEWYKPYLFETYDNAGSRFHELENLCQELKTCESLSEFAAEILLNKIDLDKDEENSLILSTIHSAKGKEWDCVYLINVADDAIPLRRSSADLEEERRLLYVAMTRAKEQLFLFQPLTDKISQSQTQLSRFLRLINQNKELNSKKSDDDDDDFNEELIYVKDDSGIF